jgi:hypothetical protein
VYPESYDWDKKAKLEVAKENNGLFNKKISQLEFVQIVKKERNSQGRKLADIRHGKWREVEQEEQMIPEIPNTYFRFKDSK